MQSVVIKENYGKENIVERWHNHSWKAAQKNILIWIQKVSMIPNNNFFYKYKR